MNIDKVIQKLNKNIKFSCDRVEVQEMLVNSITKESSIIGMVLIDLLKQAEEGQFK